MNHFILAFLIAVNLLTMIVYGIDKYKAKKDKWRISKSTLLTLALIAPWGAILGMLLFNHKTSKPKFKLVYLFAVLHIVLICLIYYYR